MPQAPQPKYTLTVPEDHLITKNPVENYSRTNGGHYAAMYAIVDGFEVQVVLYLDQGHFTGHITFPASPSIPLREKHVKLLLGLLRYPDETDGLIGMTFSDESDTPN